MHHLANAIAAVLLLAAAAAPGWSQAPTTIDGIVLSNGGYQLEGARVSITNDTTGALATFTSRADGWFGPLVVDAGDYDIEATLKGYKGDFETVTVAPGQSVSVTHTLTPI